MIVAIATYSASVASDAPLATYSAQATGNDPATYSADVETTFVESYDARSTAWRYRVVLNGVAVPDADLVGGVSWEESIDTPHDVASFSLVGRAWSIFRTLTTWTKVPVEVWITHGPAHLGDQEMTDELVFSGIVLPATSQDAAAWSPVVNIQAASNAALYDRIQLCHEVEPFAGLHRGEIAAAIGDDVGVTIQAPAGALYDKPVFTDSKLLFEFLQPFGEPEGWYWKVEGSTIVAYVAEIKHAPHAPDHTWHRADCISVTADSPKEPPSRWVIRGLGAVVVDELGLTTEYIKVTVEEFYAPVVAVLERATDGTTSATGIDPDDPALIVTKLFESWASKRGSRQIQQIDREYGWYNPRKAKLRTPNVAEGDGPVDGYYYVQSYIDETGAYVLWNREKFVEVGERRVQWLYDATESLTGTEEEEDGWYSRTSGVKAVDPGDPDQSTWAWVNGALVSDDDESFDRVGALTGQIEVYGRKSRRTTEYEYDETTGAALRETRLAYGYRALRTAIDVGGYYVRYDGQGQNEIVANWRQTGGEERINILAGGRLRGTIESTSGYTVRKIIGGSHAWGDFEANDSVEKFVTLTRKHTRYDWLSQDTYEEAVYEGDGAPTVRVIVGRIPLPRFLLSPWTRLVQEPIEVVDDDATIEALFGFSRQVLSSDYAQSPEEMQAMLRRRKARALARPITVVRPITAARRGDTVLFVDPVQGIHNRCLLVSARCELDFTRGPIGTYVLEPEF